MALDERLQTIVRYRVEQDVSIRLNRIPVNTTTVKTDYTINYEHGNSLFYSVRVDDHISKITPDSHQGFVELVKDIDVIKNNVDLFINPLTGKPETIKNHQEIINQWNFLKEELLKKNKVIRAKETRQGLLDFLSAFDWQISSHEQLIACMENQIFFNTFFDNYLVSMQKFESSLAINYTSQLFENITVPLIISQKIIHETPEVVSISKASVPMIELNTNIIKKQYDEKYRPTIECQFSEYQVKYDAQVDFNTIMNCIDYADIRIDECVRNNIEMDIGCRIRRIG